MAELAELTSPHLSKLTGRYGHTYDIETCYTYDMTLDERHIMSSQTSRPSSPTNSPKLPFDTLTRLLRRDPTWSRLNDDDQPSPTPSEILVRYSQLGDMAPLIYLYASRQRDHWTRTEETLERIVGMRPNHTGDQGKAIAANLRLISAAAAVMAGLYEAYDVELAGEGE